MSAETLGPNGRFALLVEGAAGADIGLVLLGADGRVTTWSSGAESLTKVGGAACPPTCSPGSPG